MFESGEVKFVILRLLKEKPRHGYEVIKALEEKLGGYYTPSAGTVYPTLQLLEDEGYVRAVETEGKKVYSPGHPDADPQGFVTMPNVNPVHEVVNLLSASRGYEANTTAVETLKQMASRALDILR